MTAQTDTKMPEWPEKPAKDDDAWPWAVYKRDRADAWEARCRVAVEALRMMTDDQCDWYTSAVELANMDGHERKAKIDEALAAIGPLPLPGEGE